MKAVKWGVLGAANFALQHMAPAIHAARGAEFYALGTPNPDKAEGFRDFCPTLRVLDSYEAVLADPEVEAVYIPLPNHLHVIWTLKALAAGKHVLTEKPIALQAHEIDHIIAARDKAGKLAAEAYMIVFHPQWRRAKALVAEGAIGRLLHVDAAFSYNLPASSDNIRNRADAAGGGIRDIGVYTYGATRFVTGAEPVELQSRVIRENGVDTWAQVTGVMAPAAKTPHVARFTYSAMTSMRLFLRQEVVFQGDKGMIRVANAPFNANVHDQAQVELHQPGHSVVIERYPGVNQYVLQVEAFSRSVRMGTPYDCPLEFVRGTQAMIDRVFQVEHELVL